MRHTEPVTPAVKRRLDVTDKKDQVERGRSASPCVTCRQEVCEGCQHAGGVPKWQQITLPLVVGTLFGLALQKSRVFEPVHVIKQMVFEENLMLQIFLSAVGASCLVFGLLAIFAPEQFGKGHSIHFEKRRGFGVVAIGSVISGVGMTMSGSCPGTIAAQVGAGTSGSLITAFGGILGALLYSVVEKHIRPYIRFYACDSCGVDVILGRAYESVAIAFGVVFLGAMLSVGWLTGNLSIESVLNMSLFSATWPIALCGIIIGLLQAPAVVILGARGLGASAAYVSVAGLGLNALGESVERFVNSVPYLREAVTCSFQVLCVAGIAIGSFISSATSGTFATVLGVSPIRALLGGILVLFGSRLANGCTSGHGITGFGHLATVSVLAVCGMFGGGISSAMLVKYGLGLPVW